LQNNHLHFQYSHHQNKLLSLWAHNRHKFNGSARTEKNSYFLGLLAGFYDKLKNQGEKIAREIKADEARAIVPISGDRELDEYVGGRFPRLQKVSRRSAKIYRNTYNDGMSTGRTITLAKGVSGESPQSGRFLAA